MQRVMCKSKIHRATVTGADLHYVGSITIDPLLMEAADLLPYEQVHVVNVNNGARFETYAIPGAPGAGEICLNGAAARLAHPGDRVIVISYAQYSEAELADYRPAFVFVDDDNRLTTEHAQRAKNRQATEHAQRADARPVAGPGKERGRRDHLRAESL